MSMPWQLWPNELKPLLTLFTTSIAAETTACVNRTPDDRTNILYYDINYCSVVIVLYAVHVHVQCT